MNSCSLVASLLAQAIMAGPLSEQAILERLTRLAGLQPCLAAIARRVCERYARRTRPREGDLEQFLKRDRVCRQGLQALRRVAMQLPFVPEFAPPVWLASSRFLPPLTTLAELGAWVGVTSGQLEWFADERGWERRTQREALRHYRYRWIRKRRGRARLIEAPKLHLKRIQRQILCQILDHVSPHAAAHGYCRGKSVITFAAPHVGREAVLRMDLTDFFPSISRARICGWFRCVGYPRSVARALAALCTNDVPAETLTEYPFPEDRRQMEAARALYSRPHLPQGAPTSPTLANLCAFHLDARLTGLATAAGARYTRYADDLLFSGDASFGRAWRRFAVQVAALVEDEGFRVNFHKTHIMRQSARQSSAGIVLNRRLGVRRDECDRLRAMLFNCVRYGPESQNRQGRPNFRDHLRGRIAYVAMIHPERGKKLRALFDQIAWCQRDAD